MSHAEIELIAMERMANLVKERIDLAVRISRHVDDGLIARPLGACRSVLCASPAYLHKHKAPAKPEDLAIHRCITHAYIGRSESCCSAPVTRAGCGSAAYCRAMRPRSRARPRSKAAGSRCCRRTSSAGSWLARGELTRVLPDSREHLAGAPTDAPPPPSSEPEKSSTGRLRTCG